VAAGAEHAGDVRRGGHAHARAHVAEVTRVLQQHHRLAPLAGEHDRRIDRRTLGERDHTGGGRERSELLEHIRFDLADELA